MKKQTSAAFEYKEQSFLGTPPFLSQPPILTAPPPLLCVSKVKHVVSSQCGKAHHTGSHAYVESATLLTLKCE